MPKMPAEQPVPLAPGPEVRLSYEDDDPRNMYLSTGIGDLDWFRIHTVLKRAVPDLTLCYRKDFKGRRDPPQDALLTLQVGAMGNVVRATTLFPRRDSHGYLSSALRELSECINASVDTLHFKGQGPAEVYQVLEFVPTQE